MFNGSGPIFIVEAMNIGPEERQLEGAGGRPKALINDGSKSYPAISRSPFLGPTIEVGHSKRCGFT